MKLVNPFVSCEKRNAAMFFLSFFSHRSQDVSSSGQAMDEERFVKETVKEPLSSTSAELRSIEEYSITR